MGGVRVGRCLRSGGNGGGTPLPLPLPLLLPLGSPSVYRRGVGARSGKRCGVCLSGAQRSEFSRAPLRAPTTRDPRGSGAAQSGSPFFAYLFLAKQKK